MDRLCPAGRKEAAGFARCLLGIQPTDHSISLGKVPLQQEKLGYAEQTKAQVFKPDIWQAVC